MVRVPAHNTKIKKIRKIRKIFHDYILSWFIGDSFDCQLLLDEQHRPEPIHLSGAFDGGIALGRYRDKDIRGRSMLGETIYRFKYRKNEKCGLALAELLRRFMIEYGVNQEFNISTIVPPTKNIKKSPMKFIVRHIDPELIGAYKKDLLVRNKFTGQFKDLPDIEIKRDTAEGLFSVNPKIDVAFKSILIFDDLTDSGATLNACTKALKTAGASIVLAVTLATTGEGNSR